MQTRSAKEAQHIISNAYFIFKEHASRGNDPREIYEKVAFYFVGSVSTWYLAEILTLVEAVGDFVRVEEAQRGHASAIYKQFTMSYEKTVD